MKLRFLKPRMSKTQPIKSLNGGVIWQMCRPSQTPQCSRVVLGAGKWREN